MLDNVPAHLDFVVGLLLIAIGFSFCWKCFQAMVKGKMKYWDGFLPFTLISPFTMHLPTSKRSLAKETEGLWIHMLMGPLFMFCAILCLAAGADLVNLPGTSTVNLVLNGGKAGSDAITFDKHSGYRFPIINKAKPVFAKLFGGNVGLDEKQRMVQENHESLNDAMNK